MKTFNRLCVLILVMALFIPGLTFADETAEEAADEWMEAQVDKQASDIIKELEKNIKLDDDFKVDLKASIKGYLKDQLKKYLSNPPASLAMASILDAIARSLKGKPGRPAVAGGPCPNAAANIAWTVSLRASQRVLDGASNSYMDLMESVLGAPKMIEEWTEKYVKELLKKALDALRDAIRKKLENNKTEVYARSDTQSGCTVETRVFWNKAKYKFYFAIFGDCRCAMVPVGIEGRGSVPLARWSVSGEGIAAWQGDAYEKQHSGGAVPKNNIKGTAYVKGKPKVLAVCCIDEEVPGNAIDPYDIKVSMGIPGTSTGEDEETAYAAPPDARTMLPEAAIAGGKIYGMVIDDAGEPIPDSAVQVVTTLTGEIIATRTDAEGEFVVDVPSEGDSLQFMVTGSEIAAAVIPVLQSIGHGRTAPPDYIEAGSRVTMRGNYPFVELQPGGAEMPSRVPVGIATSSDGLAALTTYEVPRYLPAGQLKTRLHNASGGEVEQYETSVFRITSATIDDRSLRAGERAEFVYEMDFGTQPTEDVYYDIALTGSIRSSQAGNPERLAIDREGAAELKGAIQVIPGAAPGPFSISINIGTSLEAFADTISSDSQFNPEETVTKCRIPTKPRCAKTVTHGNNQTTVNCELVWTKTKRDKSHSGQCGIAHGTINLHCKAYLASAGTSNERALCKAAKGAAKKAVTFQCVPDGTGVPIPVDGSLNDSVTANWP